MYAARTRFLPLSSKQAVSEVDWPASMPGRPRLPRSRAPLPRRAPSQEPAAPADALVSGHTVRAVLAALGPFRARGEAVLAKHGLADADAGRWYPLRAYVETLRAIRDELGPNTLLQIGKQVTQGCARQAGEASMESVLAGLGTCYQALHRKLEGADFSYEATSHRTALATSRSPYPCEFVRGAILGAFQAQLGTGVEVTHVEDGCKSEGDAACTFLVKLPLP